MRKIISLFLILFTLTLCSCNSNQTGIINTDENFVIGIDANYPPFAYTDDNGNLVGYDLSLANEVANRLGMELEIYPLNWNEKDEILKSGQIDAIWSGFTITPEREELYSFTDPYLDVQPVIVVPEDSDINSINDLADKVVGVQEGSYAYELLQSLPIYEQIDHETLFEENVNALKNLDVGLTDALIVDSSVANWYINNKNADYKIVDSLGDLKVGVAFDQNNNELRDQVNKILEDLKQEGVSESISIEWFGNNETPQN